MSNRAYVAIINDSPLGDSLCAMAAVQVIAAEAEREGLPFYLTTERKESEMLMRPRNTKTLRDLPGRSTMEVYRLYMGRILSEEGMARHPILAYLKQGGMPHSESDMPTPYVHIVRHFNYNSGKLELPPIHHADVLIHPFSVGNADLRMMPLEKYERVFERLAEHRGDLTIGVLGMGHDAVPWRSLRQREDVVIKYLYGYHLQEVIRMMCAANVLLTADSGMNRLAAIAHYDRHIILRPESYPEYWVTHPGAICIGGTPATWDPDQIADTMIAVMEKKEQPV